MRMFYLWRGKDPTGKSGLGFVAEGVVFDDGSAVVKWRTARKSTVIWEKSEDAFEVHGHSGTHVVWDHSDFVAPDGVPMLNADTGFSRASDSQWMGTGSPGKDGWMRPSEYLRAVAEQDFMATYFTTAADGTLTPTAAWHRRFGQVQP